LGLEEFEHLWTTEASEHVLCKTPTGYLVVKVTGKEPLALIIEDDDLAKAVKARMIEAGVPVVDDLSGFAN
jgi:hypothetical protein